jgi:hypothetical protein
MRVNFQKNVTLHVHETAFFASNMKVALFAAWV